MQNLSSMPQKFDQALKPEQRPFNVRIESEANLFDQVNRWLERTPFLKMQGYDFWKLYQETVEQTVQSDLKIIQSNPALGPETESAMK